MVLMAYDYEIVYRKSSQHGNANSLSRLPIPDTTFDDPDADAMYALYEETMHDIPIDSSMIQMHTNTDSTLKKVIQFIDKGWPTKPAGDASLKPYFQVKDELTVANECVFRGMRVIIPKALQKECMDLLHNTHMGATRMKQSARRWIWWPEINSDISKISTHCENCQRNASKPPETFSSWPNPDTPWQRIHIDFLGPFWN